MGAGRSDTDLAEVAGGQFSTDLDMRMGALGVRQELVGALALKADAFSVRIESADAGSGPSVSSRASLPAPLAAGRSPRAQSSGPAP